MVPLIKRTEEKRKKKKDNESENEAVVVKEPAAGFDIKI